MRRQPCVPAGDADRGQPLQAFAGKRPCHRRAEQRTQQAGGVASVGVGPVAPVVQQMGRVPHQAAHAEAALDAADAAIEDDGRVGEGTEAHGDRNAAEGVVDDLMSLEKRQGIGPRLAADHHAHHPIRADHGAAAMLAVVLGHLSAGERRRVVERRQEVAAVAARGQHAPVERQVREIEAVALDPHAVADPRRPGEVPHDRPQQHEQGGADDRPDRPADRHGARFPSRGGGRVAHGGAPSPCGSIGCMTTSRPPSSHACAETGPRSSTMIPSSSGR